MGVFMLSFNRINTRMLFSTFAKAFIFSTALASTAFAADFSINATSMTQDTGGPTTINGLAAWNVWSTGAIHAMVPISPTSSYNIKVRALGQTAANVLAEMDVQADGVSLKKFPVTADAFNTYTVTANLAAGTRKISVRFTNDYNANGQDRNLVVYNLVVSAAAVAPAPTPVPAPTPAPVASTTGNFNIRSLINQNFCADIAAWASTNGSRMYIWSCVAGENNQVFNFTAAGEIRIHGKCLDASSATNGSQLQINDCSGVAKQKFSYNATLYRRVCRNNVERKFFKHVHL
jgi:Ca-dependent carbohydrate-binding module xylan-binding/Ricin-type beta-trefoil lectin domain